MGPAKTIVLSQALSQQQIADIDAWLWTFAVSIDSPVKPGNWFFFVTDLTMLHLASVEKPCAFGLVVVDPMSEMEENEAERIMIELGSWPRSGLNIWAGCKGHIDHLTLAHILLQMMERYAGWLDVDREDSYHKFEYEMEQSMHGQERTEKRQSIPGEKRKIVYWDSYLHEWQETILIDANRFHSWLRHPDFYFMK
jgi:hypothetical protein